MHYFELYTNKDELKKEDWQKLYTVLGAYIGMLGSFEIIVKLQDNLLRFFIASQKDLGAVSNNIKLGVLQSVEPKLVGLPDRAHGRERLVRLVTGGNILALKEKIQVKRGKELEFVKIKIRRLNNDKSVTRAYFYFKDAAGQWQLAKKLMPIFPSHLLAIDFKKSSGYQRKSQPKYLNLEKSLHMLTGQKEGALFQVDAFPYFNTPYYINIANYEFDKHSFIVGASGSGKSKFIELFVKTLHESPFRMNYRVVVIDPHASLGESWHDMPDTKMMSFSDDTAELFPGAGTDITAGTELTTTLFKSLLADQFNPRAERVIRFSLYVLMTAQAMTLSNLKRFVSDLEYREQIMSHVKDHVPPNIVQFFATDFNELRTKYHNESITPVISLVDEMELQPAFVNQGDQSLAKLVNDNFLTLFSLNKVSMGEKVVKTVAGLIIQQVFLLAQARAFNQKVILIIDEVSVVQNPAIAQILAEARKFNLSIFLTQQYFGQVEKDLQAAIFSNVINYYSFKVSEEDARVLEGNLNIELPKEIVKKEHDKGVKESDYKVKMLTALSKQEAIVRISSEGKILPAIKAKTMNVEVTKEAKVTADQLVELAKSAEAQKLPDKFVEKPIEHGPLPHSTEPQITHTSPGQPIAQQEHYVSAPQPASTQPANLSELLAQHSSSRDKQKE